MNELGSQTIDKSIEYTLQLQKVASGLSDTLQTSGFFCHTGCEWSPWWVLHSGPYPSQVLPFSSWKHTLEQWQWLTQSINWVKRRKMFALSSTLLTGWLCCCHSNRRMKCLQIPEQQMKSSSAPSQLLRMAWKQREQKVKSGCGCSTNRYRSLDASSVHEHILPMCEYAKAEQDLCIMDKLAVKPGKHSEQKRKRCGYTFDGQEASKIGFLWCQQLGGEET